MMKIFHNTRKKHVQTTLKSLFNIHIVSYLYLLLIIWAQKQYVNNVLREKHSLIYISMFIYQA